jgi:carboxypeptidase PM20D1
MPYQREDYATALKFWRPLAGQGFADAEYPEVHSSLKREIVNAYSLLYTWEGRDTSLKPILISAHIDVVPVEPGTEDDWDYPPFSGEIADGFIWGRGTLDVKQSILGMLEAIEILVAEGFSPEHTIYLAFGHDEEIGGQNGAAEIAKLLAESVVRAPPRGHLPLAFKPWN